MGQAHVGDAGVKISLRPESNVNSLKFQEKNGVVYTKRWVVDLILDLVGYISDCDLTQMVAIEPAAGDGAFLLPMASRLLISAQRDDISLAKLTRCLIAYELDPKMGTQLRQKLAHWLIVEHDVHPPTAQKLADSWVRIGNFLSEAICLPPANFVVGNPPYIRIEDVDELILADYRRLYSTMIGRADVYVAFFEAALRSLKPEGVCGFICADRWMSNQYGAALRDLMSNSYSVETVIKMNAADLFSKEVSVRPVITVIRRSNQESAVVACAMTTTAETRREAITTVIKEVRRKRAVAEFPAELQATRIDSWFVGRDSWPVGAPERLTLLQRLEAEFPQLEDSATGTRVTIGVASGADKIFVINDGDCVESSRLLPLAMASDVASGQLEWSGHYLVNPWEDDGLVVLDAYPRLKAYFERHTAQLKNRHIAKKRPDSWYRTIDRVGITLAAKPKLYIPDTKKRLFPVLDGGETYPHHNLYVIVADGWDLEILGGLLLSDIAQFFVESYAVRMRGGYLRFQAQYLRKIRIPKPDQIDTVQAERLREAFHQRDVKMATLIACQLYGLPVWPPNEVTRRDGDQKSLMR